MTTEVSTEDGTSVYVVVRDSDGVEYGGTFTVKVSDKDSYGYSWVLDGATPTGVADSYYVVNGDPVDLIITGDDKAFIGKVYVLKYEDGKLVRDWIDGSIADDNNKKSTYSIPVDGVGTYFIEILNVDKDSNGDYVEQITLNVVPQSVGAGAGLIINGN